jgi:hypothetical protein
LGHRNAKLSCGFLVDHDREELSRRVVFDLCQQRFRQDFADATVWRDFSGPLVRIPKRDLLKPNVIAV